jgi:hypothetical protein
MWRDRQTTVDACTKLLNGQRLTPKEREQWANLKERRLARRINNAGACATLLSGRIPRPDDIEPEDFAFQAVLLLLSASASPSGYAPSGYDSRLGHYIPSSILDVVVFAQLLSAVYNTWASPKSPVNNPPGPASNTASNSTRKWKLNPDHALSFVFQGVKARAFFKALAERQGDGAMTLPVEAAMMLTWFIMTYLSPLSGWQSLGLRTTVTVVLQTAQFFALTKVSKADLRRMFVGEHSFFETLKRGIQYLRHDVRRALTEFRALLSMLRVPWPNFLASVRWALTDRLAFRAWMVDAYAATETFMTPATRTLVRIVFALMDMATTLPIRRSRPEGYLFLRNHPLRAQAVRMSKTPNAIAPDARYVLRWTAPTTSPVTTDIKPNARRQRVNAPAPSTHDSRRNAKQNPPRRPPAPPATSLAARRGTAHPTQ